MMNKLKIGIVGLGRFGSVWKQILEKDHDVSGLDRKGDAKEFYANNDVVFIAVPIPAFEELIKTHAQYMRSGQLIIDVLSVKLHAKEVFEKYLPAGVEAMLTHPMFGPDSIAVKGLPGLPIIIDKFKASMANYSFWKKYFESLQLKVIELSAEEHDRLAARSQGVTHFMGRLLAEFGLEATPIDTIGAIKLQEVMQQTCNDSWELFLGLQNYNPYTKKMRLDFGHAYDKVYNKLLPELIEPGVIHFGIQGGKGSFNEQALADYVERHSITNYEIHYLYTSERVLANLHAGEIDFGLFAIHNSVGGIVNESIQAIAKYKFTIVEEFAIKIRHMLMCLPNIEPVQITTIMAHDQVLKQCKNTLLKKYPELKQTSGKGDLLDTANAAKALSLGEIPANIFILGPAILAELYNLKTIDSDLQDSLENLTSFLLVSR